MSQLLGRQGCGDEGLASNVIKKEGGWAATGFGPKASLPCVGAASSTPRRRIVEMEEVANMVGRRLSRPVLWRKRNRRAPWALGHPWKNAVIGQTVANRLLALPGRH